MKDVGFDRLLKNISFEIGDEGIRLKVFGIPYFLTDDQIDTAVSFLMRLKERLDFIRKEKERLLKQASNKFLNG